MHSALPYLSSFCSACVGHVVLFSMPVTRLASGASALGSMSEYEQVCFDLLTTADVANLRLDAVKPKLKTGVNSQPAWNASSSTAQHTECMRRYIVARDENDQESASRWAFELFDKLFNSPAAIALIAAMHSLGIFKTKASVVDPLRRPIRTRFPSMLCSSGCRAPRQCLPLHPFSPYHRRVQNVVCLSSGTSLSLSLLSWIEQCRRASML